MYYNDEDPNEERDDAAQALYSETLQEEQFYWNEKEKFWRCSKCDQVMCCCPCTDSKGYDKLTEELPGIFIALHVVYI